MEKSDAEVGTDDVGVFADKRGSVVGVEFVGNASTKDGLLEGVMKALGVFARVVGGVCDEATVVIDEDGEVRGDDLALGTGEFGAGAEVGHPEVVGKGGFECFARSVKGIELCEALPMEASISEKPVDGGEGGQVFDVVVFYPSPVGDFDGDLRMVLPLFDEPVLLFFGEATVAGMVV